MNIKNLLKWVVAGAAAACLGAAAATPTGAGADPDAAIRAAIHKSFPQSKVEDVRAAPIPGLYEVFTGSQLLYSDRSGQHLFIGQLLDTATKHDLAEDALQERLRIDFNSLPFDRAIKIVKGAGTRRLAVFEDPDCPYCQRLEKQLANVDDVTVYVFLFPLTDLHPEAEAHAHEIWCSSDRAGAWTHWMLDRKAPEPAPASCDSDPTDALSTLAVHMHVDSTPTLFFADGQRAKGAFETAQINSLLDSHPADAVRSAAAKSKDGGRGRAAALPASTAAAPRS